MRPGHADIGLIEERPHRLQILGKRCLYERAAPEYDQGYTVTVTRFNEITDDLPNRGEPLERFIRLGAKVPFVHRTGNVDGKDQVARRLVGLDRLPDTLGPGQRNHQQPPDQYCRQHLHMPARNNH